MKRCARCKQQRPSEDFGKNARYRDGLQSYCRGCMKAYHRGWRPKNRTKLKEKQNARRALDPGLMRNRVWASHLKKHYGMTPDEYDAMRDAQDGLCFICQREAELLYVDHDHDTGAVRKLLCPRCNTGLGLFGDDPEALLAAADYLVSHRAEVGRAA